MDPRVQSRVVGDPDRLRQVLTSSPLTHIISSLIHSTVQVHILPTSFSLLFLPFPCPTLLYSEEGVGDGKSSMEGGEAAYPAQPSSTARQPLSPVVRGTNAE